MSPAPTYPDSDPAGLDLLQRYLDARGALAEAERSGDRRAADQAFDNLFTLAELCRARGLLSEQITLDE